MASTRRRVKLYTLNEDRQWDDRGTGHVSSSYVERLQGMSIMVRSEEDGLWRFYYPELLLVWFYDGWFIEEARKTCRKLTRLLRLQVQFYSSQRYSRTLPIRNNRFVFFFKVMPVALQNSVITATVVFFIIGDSNCLVRGRQLWSSTQLPRESGLRWNLGENLSGEPENSIARVFDILFKIL